MPHEFDAVDWILWVEFDENERVTSLKIRLSDSKEFKPKDTPDDKRIKQEENQVFAG